MPPGRCGDRTAVAIERASRTCEFNFKRVFYFKYFVTHNPGS
jgi:hypothetical protein